MLSPAESFDLDPSPPMQFQLAPGAHREVDCEASVAHKQSLQLGELVRVLLLEVPLLLRGILEHAIETTDGCEVLKKMEADSPVLMGSGPPPDAVILGLTATVDATLVPTLFARWPQARIMTVTQAGNDAMVYDLSPKQRALGEVSAADIVEALRVGARNRIEP